MGKIDGERPPAPAAQPDQLPISAGRWSQTRMLLNYSAATPLSNSRRRDLLCGKVGLQSIRL